MAIDLNSLRGYRATFSDTLSKRTTASDSGIA
jgi:hypothetical protein